MRAKKASSSARQLSATIEVETEGRTGVTQILGPRPHGMGGVGQFQHGWGDKGEVSRGELIGGEDGELFGVEELKLLPATFWRAA